MSRWTGGLSVLLVGTVIITLAVVWGSAYHRRERYSLTTDLLQALKHPELIDAAEKRCFDLKGCYH